MTTNTACVGEEKGYWAGNKEREEWEEKKIQERFKGKKDLLKKD